MRADLDYWASYLRDNIANNLHSVTSWSLDSIRAGRWWVEGFRNDVWNLLDSWRPWVPWPLNVISDWIIDRFKDHVGWAFTLAANPLEQIEGFYNSHWQGDQGTWDWVSGTRWALSFLVSIADAVGGWIDDAFSDINGLIEQYIFPLIRNIWDFIIGLPAQIENGLNNLWNWAQDNFNNISNNISDIWNWLQAETSNLWTALGNEISNVRNDLGNAIDNTRDYMLGELNSYANSINDVIDFVRERADSIAYIIDHPLEFIWDTIEPRLEGLAADWLKRIW